MAQYKCENCNALRDKPVCPKCGADTHLIDLPEPSLDELAERVSRKAAAAETAGTKPGAPPPKPAPKPAAPPLRPDPPPLRESVSTAQAPRPVPPPRPRVVPTPAPPAEPAPQPQPEASSEIMGLDAFHTLLDRGVKAVIICGASGSGKSEIAYGYIRANSLYHGKSQTLALRATLRTDAALGATNPGEIWFQPIDHRRAFLDPSGEFFTKLSPNQRQLNQRPDVTEADFLFVQRAVANLAGIVLVVNLTSVVDDRVPYPWKGQEEDLSFVLAALRWLRWDKEARPPALGFTPNVAQRVSLFPRLDKRVLVLFSKADQLTKYTNQPPLDFARKRLPMLHGALMTHARRFRYDFCHTMRQVDPVTAIAVDPCGVLLPMNWLLDDWLRWLPVQLPTGWIGGGR